MRIIAFLVVFGRLLQTVTYIMLFHFSLLKLKNPKKKRILITSVFYLIVIFVYFAVLLFGGQRLGEALIVPFEVALCLILIVICSADKWQVSLFVMFTQFNTLLGVSYISDILAPSISEIGYQMVYLLIRLLLLGGILLLNVSYLRPYFRRLVEYMGREWHLLVVASVSFYILEAVILYYPRLYWYEEDNRWYLVLSSYLVFISIYWLIFHSIGSILKRMELQERERILAMQNKMWEEQIVEQKELIMQARRDRHDLRHHCDSVLHMLENGNTKEAKDYLNTQVQGMNPVIPGNICQHFVANTILTRWESRAREKGIQTKMEVRIPADLGMDDVSLVGMLANALENAVEGCEKCSDEIEKYIAVKIVYSVYNGAGKLQIMIENSCEENVEFEDGYPKSIKAGGGTGTRSIAYVVEKHHGMVDFEAKEGTFSMRAILPLSHTFTP